MADAKAFNPANFITAWFAYSQIDTKVGSRTWLTIPRFTIDHTAGGNPVHTAVNNAIGNFKVT